MTVFQMWIVSQRKIKDCYSFAAINLIENEKPTLPDGYQPFF